MFKKLVKKATKVLSIFIVVVIILALGIIVAEPFLYNDFFGKDSQKEFETPGISDDFIQQGICVVDDETFLVSGYMKGKKPSRIYIVDRDDDKTTYVQLKDEKGEYTTNHSGGISTYANNVYVCCSGGVRIYSLSEILDATDGGDVVAKSKFEIDGSASFCQTYNNYLYVGEFYKPGSYDTDDSHKLTTPSGDKNNAMIFAYKLNSDGSFAQQEPVCAISITDRIQGMAFCDNKIYLSCSYGLLTSKIYVYDQNKANQSQSTMTVDGNNLPLVYLDSYCIVDTIYAPPMAEEIVYHDGRLFVLNESACNKYYFGKLLRAKYVWSIKID